MANIWTALLGIAGFLIAFYIWKKKMTETPLVCPVGKSKDCNLVVSSKYSKTFGMKNEVLGMLYYGFVVLLSVLAIAGFGVIGISLALVLLITAVIAVLMSIYFTILMGFVIKKWCDYCIASALISAGILVVELFVIF